MVRGRYCIGWYKRPFFTFKNKDMKNIWTQFMDMNSGGGQKEKFSQCFIEAPEEEAKIIFYNRFGHNPSRVTCTCCGEDYSITETNEGLDQVTGYERNCKGTYFKDGVRVNTWGEGHEYRYIEEPDANYKHGGKVLPLEEYIKMKDVCVIYAKDIKAEERQGDVPQEGYVWI